jgi:hypothetical protein
MFHPTVQSLQRRRSWSGATLLLGFVCALPDCLFAQGLLGQGNRADRDVPLRRGAAETRAAPGRGRKDDGRGRDDDGRGRAGGRLPGPRTRTRPGSTRKKDKPAKGAEKDAAVDPDELPPGYTVPPEAPEWLTTTEEWKFEPFDGDTDKERDLNKRRKIQRYNDLVSKGEFANADDRKLIAEIVEYYLAQMTLKDAHEKASETRERLYRNMRNSGSAPGTKLDVRVFMMQTVVEKAPRLFGYHFAARLNGAILLADLSNLNEKAAEGRNPAVRCSRAYPVLINLLKAVDEKNHKQPDAVRIWLVEGLVRIATLPDLNKPQVRVEIAEALVEQMATSVTDDNWLQWRMAEGLGLVGIVYNNQKKPIVAEVLAAVLADSRRSFLVRAEAGSSLGRLPLDREIDLNVIAQEIAQLARQMTEAYQKSPNKSSWKVSFLRLFMAFKPINDDDAKEGHGMLTQVMTKGPLSGYKKTVQEAYEVVLPLVQGVLNPPQNLDEAVAKLKDWLNRNPPPTARTAEKDESAGEQPRSTAPGGQAPAGAGPAAG